MYNARLCLCDMLTYYSENLKQLMWKKFIERVHGKFIHKTICKSVIMCVYVIVDEYKINTRGSEGHAALT